MLRVMVGGKMDCAMSCDWKVTGGRDCDIIGGW